MNTDSCEICKDRGWLLVNNDVHGLRVERCDACSNVNDRDVYEAACKTLTEALAIIHFRDHAYPEQPVAYDATALEIAADLAADAIKARAKQDGYNNYDPVEDDEGYAVSLMTGIAHLAYMRQATLKGNAIPRLAYFWDGIHSTLGLWKEDVNDRCNALGLGMEEMYARLRGKYLPEKED